MLVHFLCFLIPNFAHSVAFKIKLVRAICDKKVRIGHVSGLTGQAPQLFFSLTVPKIVRQSKTSVSMILSTNLYRYLQLAILCRCISALELLICGCNVSVLFWGGALLYVADLPPCVCDTVKDYQPCLSKKIHHCTSRPQTS